MLKNYLCVIALIFIGSQTALAQKVGTIMEASGDVWLMEEGKAWRLNQGDEVNHNHTIITENKSIARVELLDGSLLNVGANTRLKLQRYVQDESDAFTMSFDVLWGNVRYFVKTIVDPNSAFNVKTATAAIGVRGTQFEVRMPYPDNISGLRFSPSASLTSIGLQSTTVDMEEGLTVLTDLKGKEHKLPAGTISTIDAEGNFEQKVKDAPVVALVPVTLPEPSVSWENTEGQNQKAGAKAAITTNTNASALQGATITPPRTVHFGGR